ncbi:MAG: hypothetical protein WKF89_07915 [Chitinophagaceae bacterium]
MLVVEPDEPVFQMIRAERGAFRRLTANIYSQAFMAYAQRTPHEAFAVNKMRLIKKLVLIKLTNW